MMHSQGLVAKISVEIFSSHFTYVRRQNNDGTFIWSIHNTYAFIDFLYIIEIIDYM